MNKKYSEKSIIYQLFFISTILLLLSSSSFATGANNNGLERDEKILLVGALAGLCAGGFVGGLLAGITLNGIRMARRGREISRIETEAIRRVAAGVVGPAGAALTETVSGLDALEGVAVVVPIAVVTTVGGFAIGAVAGRALGNCFSPQDISATN